MGWTSPIILGLSVLTILLLSAFVLQECRAGDPLLDLSLFKDKNFLAINLLLSLVFFSYAGINYLLPFYLKYIRGIDTSTAGTHPDGALGCDDDRRVPLRAAL